MQIYSIHAIEILDSRGNPTLKSFVTLEDGTVGSAAVPSGASTGSHEALELRDGDEHFFGLGVDDAAHNVHAIIGPALKGMDINKLEQIDKKMIELDGTKNKSKIGANAILSVSLACARAYAVYHKEPLWRALNEHYFPHSHTGFPRLFVNVINGGAHADWNIDIQECMVSPQEHSPSASVEMAANIFHTLKKILHDDGFSIAVGDECGFAPNFSSNKQAFGYLERAIKEAGYVRKYVDIATDIAATEFYVHDEYAMQKEGESYTADELMDYYEQLIAEHNILSLEDPFAEDDWSSFSAFTQAVGKKCMIVGDDLFVTQKDRIQKGIDTKAANALLVKVNQVGTLFETIEAIKLARSAGWKIIISHRSGETSDPFISDLAVACDADFIKSGSMSRSDRLAKYNRLLEIEKIEY